MNRQRPLSDCCKEEFIKNNLHDVWCCSSCGRLPYQEELDEIQEECTDLEDKITKIQELI